MGMGCWMRSLINHFLRVGGGEYHFRSFLIITFILHAFALASHSLSHSDMITPSLALDAVDIGYISAA